MSQILRLKNLNAWYVALFLIVVLSAVPRLLTYDFSLPYIDYPDEPSAYLKAQEWRGLYRLQGWDGYPPGILVVNVVVQVAVETFGQHGISATVRVLRLIASISNLITLVLIALTARRIGGDLAGLLAGAAWGVSALVLSQGIFAVADPYVFLFTAATLWTATVALDDPDRRHWCVWSIVLGLIATLFKYLAVVVLAPGVLIAAYTVLQDRRRGFRYLAIQALLILGVAVWLLFGYQVGRISSETGTPEGNAMSALRDPAAWFQFDLLTKYLNATISPINVTVFEVASILGMLAFMVAWLRKTKRFKLGLLVPAILILVLLPEITSLIGDADVNGIIRYLMPATTAACVLLGVGVGQVYHLVKPRWRSVGLVGLGIPLAAFLFIPQIQGCVELIRERHREDWRVLMRQWADVSLDSGWVIVTKINHKVFNPDFGGLTGPKTFYWWQTTDILERPVSAWINSYKMNYAAIVLPDLRRLQGTQAGRDFLASMLRLRGFVGDPQMRGPETVFYRLWRMETERHEQFGKNIFLTGYDGRMEQASPGETLPLRLYWQASAPSAVNYSMYIHLNPVDNRTVLAQVDGSPATPGRPTTTWDDPDETLISSPFALKLPLDLPSGQYRVLVGLYDYGTGQRLTTPSGNDYVELFTLNVVPASLF